MERLCITSFLQHGHSFHLYAYDEVLTVPLGTKVLDARLVLPVDRIFRYANGSYAGFSNFFRYKLLLDVGGWWVDLDTVCLKPFDFESHYVFSSERHELRDLVDCAVIKSPPGSDFARYCWDTCNRLQTEELKWGETGPRLVAAAVEEFALQAFVHRPETFCPIDYRSWESVLNPSIGDSVGAGTYAIHLWQEQWRRSARDKDQRYAAGCLYEQLRSRYLES
jgi:Glycosyltransferase sugar-binding region containing DXD motif